MHEALNGNPFLNDVRNMALQISLMSDVREEDEGVVMNVVQTLCSTIGIGADSRFRWKNEFNRPQKWTSPEFEKQLFGAALCTNSLSHVRRSAALRNAMLSKTTCPDNSCVFGTFFELAGKFGDKELLGYLMTSAPSESGPEVRFELFKHAAQAGRIDIVRFLHGYRSEEWQWNFESDAKGNKRPLNFTLDGGHNPEAYDLIQTMRTAQGLRPTPSDMVDIKFYGSAKVGYIDMVSYLLRIGEYDKGYRTGILHIAVQYASERGHAAIVQLLLDNGANPNVTLEGAARRGHGKLVQMLLDRGVKPSEALVDAGRYYKPHTNLLANIERGPYLDVVRLLLDAGVDVNESIGKDSPLAGTIATEHTALFEFLLGRGAGLHSPGTAEECVRRAKKDGLESMLLLLEKHGVDVNVDLEEAI